MHHVRRLREPVKIHRRRRNCITRAVVLLLRLSGAALAFIPAPQRLLIIPQNQVFRQETFWLEYPHLLILRTDKLGLTAGKSLLSVKNGRNYARKRGRARIKEFNRLVETPSSLYMLFIRIKVRP